MKKRHRPKLFEASQYIILYAAVGVAFIPAGVLYAIGVSAGWNKVLTSVVCLGLGFLTAHLVWTRLQASLAPIRSPEVPLMQDNKETAILTTLKIHEKIWILKTNSASPVAGHVGYTKPFVAAPILISTAPILDTANPQHR